MIGLGTYKLDGETTYRIVKKGLELGYRLIDTAQLYKNEESVGRAIKDCSIDRADIKVVTKVWLTSIQMGREVIIKSVVESLVRLDCNYIDILLLHGPVNIVEAWQTMEDIYLGKILQLKGKVKSIGVSNYSIDDLNVLLETCRINPFCKSSQEDDHDRSFGTIYNQIELSPFCQRRELVNYCREKGITVIAHSSLTKGNMFNNPTIQKICLKHKCKSAKVLIDWSLVKGFIVLPRTSSSIHLKENFDDKIILDDQDMEQLDQIDEKYCSHPQYE